MKESEHKQLLIRELTKYGIRPVVEVTNGTHLRVRWHYPDGRYDYIISSKTPSDYRSNMNSRARIRRKLRDAGVLECPLPEGGRFNKAMSLPDPTELTLMQRVSLLEKDVDALLDLLAERHSPQEISKPEQAPPLVSHDWVLAFVSTKGVRAKEVAKISGRNYYTVYSALTSASKRGLLERNGKEWRLPNDRERTGFDPYRGSEAAAVIG